MDLKLRLLFFCNGGIRLFCKGAGDGYGSEYFFWKETAECSASFAVACMVQLSRYDLVCRLRRKNESTKKRLRKSTCLGCFVC